MYSRLDFSVFANAAKIAFYTVIVGLATQGVYSSLISSAVPRSEQANLFAAILFLICFVTGFFLVIYRAFLPKDDAQLALGVTGRTFLIQELRGICRLFIYICLYYALIGYLVNAGDNFPAFQISELLDRKVVSHIASTYDALHYIILLGSAVVALIRYSTRETKDNV
jgi:hypothetical protein